MTSYASTLYRAIIIALLAMLMQVPTASFGQDDSALKGAVERFAEAQNRLNTDDRYWGERESLARQALSIAEKDVTSSDAERLLHWILDWPRTSPVALKASQHLIAHHTTSQATIEKLLQYARSPREWTPNLFAAFATARLSPQQRSHVNLCAALHEKSLLEVADSIQLNQADHQLALGKPLLERLRLVDRSALEEQVVNAFSQIASQDQDRTVGGVSMKQFAEDSIFFVRHLRLGRPARGLEGESPLGKRIALSEYKGKVVLVDFWATWCLPCVKEIPSLQRLREDCDDASFALIGVSADEDQKHLSQFIKERGLDWPIIQDAQGKLTTRWQALSLPTYYVLDDAHVVRYYGGSFAEASRTVRKLLGSDTDDAVAELVQLTLQALDANNDRRIEPAELPEDKKEVLATADLDKDGVLSLDELKKFLRENLQSTEVKPNGPPDR